ncbi:aminotransferase class III-fold pyridoxal phosphate-dependent enzyme [Pseudomonadota bacterium]|jgi:glutamate-1-semialdehyde 2,1-aminomutase|nr:aminotransferase class III-fold pyridoxal phosphate-dependent enzyme [Pseudomonadota bacterium]
MKVIALVQARLGSVRLPEKVLKPIAERPMIDLLLTRLSRSNELDEIIVASSIDKQNDKLQSTVELLGYQCTRGSEDDVLNRFYEAATLFKADVIVRVTGDCPLVDAMLVDECIRSYKKAKVDYFSNTDPATFPDGLDIEVFSFQSLKRANQEALSEFDREHVTPYIRNNQRFSKSSLKFNKNLSNLRWTVDEPEDLIVVTRIFEHFYPDLFFDWKKVLELSKKNPEIFSANKTIVNNEGANMGNGQKLYKRAKRIIPGGNMLLSKRPEMFLPEQWPSYFSKSKGCKVWDLDGQEFIDMSIMGIGTNILGYGHSEVDEAVKRVVRDGNMSTFNCPEEVYLAEKLVEMHPWADMVRLARAGGEINSIAVRIARASTGRDKIAICGYHGWHDWYISSNLGYNKNLDGHLLPGLEPNGVPKGLAGTALPFKYNDIEQLEKIIKENGEEIAAIKMEVSRNEGPKDNFLQKVRDLASINNIVLIFDECTSGFRETFGGLHQKYEVEPDLAIFAKALGNGYAISACIGRKEYMSAVEKTFISSTFWTERIGPTAALKTLEVMEREQSWKTITKVGKNISSRWELLAQKHGLDITTWGLPALSGFTFHSNNALSYKTLITQEMLKKGYLAANSVYVCTEHTEEMVDAYFRELDPIFSIIKDCEEGLDVTSILDGPICHNGFKRLN